MTPIALRSRTTLRCPGCEKEFDCINGEVVWTQCEVDKAVWSAWYDWIVRLRQGSAGVAETGFTLHTRDFTIARGDFLVVLVGHGRLGGSRVVQVENKTTGYVIQPGQR